MRGLLLMPIVICLTAAAVAAGCSALGLNPRPREMLIASVIMLVASELAQAPLLLAASAPQSTMAQAGLAASAVHLLVAIALAGAAALLRLGAAETLALWTLPLYWATLVTLVFFIVRAIATAPVHPGTSK